MLSFSSCTIIDNTLIWRVPSPSATDLQSETPARQQDACTYIYSSSFCHCNESSCLVHDKVPPLPPKTNHVIPQISLQFIQSDQWVCLISSCPALLPVCLCECVTSAESCSVCPVLSCPSLQRRVTRTSAKRRRRRRKMVAWTGRSARLHSLHFDMPSGSR